MSSYERPPAARYNAAMTHADAFLQTILDAPDDDAPRLLFADWLDEQGDQDRAEFIRVQIALTRRNVAAGLRRREQELLALHEKEWAAPIRGIATEWTFRRGFIDEVRAEAGTFLVRADELFRQAPLRRAALQWIGGRPSHPDLLRLAICAPLQRLDGLDLTNNWLGSDGLQVLAAAPALGGLTSLKLQQCGIGDRGVRTLACSPLLTQLVHLDLRENAIGPPGLRALARSLEARPTGGGPSRLRELLLDGNPLGEAGRLAVRASPALRRATAISVFERIERGTAKKLPHS